MKSYQELLQTETYWTTKIQMELYQAVEHYLAENNMTRAEFAKKLGVTKGYVTQLLNGDFDHRLSKLVEIALFIGKIPVLQLENMDNYLQKDKSETPEKSIDAQPIPSSPSH